MEQSFEARPNWLESTREGLSFEWRRRTGHGAGSSSGWACEILHGCRQCQAHLSLPCSLAQEANEIGLFLSVPCFSQAPATFFRLYLVLLSEFCAQLESVSKMMGLGLGKPPNQVKVWANRWAKHRLHFLVQHHPMEIFADQYMDWASVSPLLTDLQAMDACGREQGCVLIDYAWLCDHDGGTPDLDEANADTRAVVIVPPLREFLEETLLYFRAFVEAAVAQPDRVRRFESEHFSLRC